PNLPGSGSGANEWCGSGHSADDDRCSNPLLGIAQSRRAIERCWLGAACAPCVRGNHFTSGVRQCVTITSSGGSPEHSSLHHWHWATGCTQRGFSLLPLSASICCSRVSRDSVRWSGCLAGEDWRGAHPQDVDGTRAPGADDASLVRRRPDHALLFNTHSITTLR